MHMLLVFVLFMDLEKTYGVANNPRLSIIGLFQTVGFL
jgi:hypothetical protein